MKEEPKLQHIYGYTNLNVQKAKHAAFEQTLSPATFQCKDPNALLGIEVEVENIREGIPLEYYWKIKADHSLRNHGVECVSIPLRGHQVEHALRYLKTQMCTFNKPDFSNRTSVHVHLNVRDMSWSQVKVLVILYALFERHFFNLAGTKREQSIFCVPLYKSNQLSTILHIQNGGTKWHKYNALNLGTILGDGDVGCYGTIEFRHLYGTDDLPTLMTWINNILLLRKASNEYKLEDLLEKVKTLNSTSEYVQLYEKIFQEYADLRSMSKKDFEYCVTHVKEVFWGYDLLRKEPYKAESSLGKKIFHTQVDDTQVNTKTYIKKHNMPYLAPGILTPEMVEKVNQDLLIALETEEGAF